MRLSITAVIVCLAASALAYAQSAPAPTPQDTTVQPSAAAPATAVPVPAGKRFACQTASQGAKGQDRRDQMQLCMAQAHLDCLKQAIAQKIVGPQRMEFIKSCAQ